MITYLSHISFNKKYERSIVDISALGIKIPWYEEDIASSNCQLLFLLTWKAGSYCCLSLTGCAATGFGRDAQVVISFSLGVHKYTNTNTNINTNKFFWMAPCSDWWSCGIRMRYLTNNSIDDVIILAWIRDHKKTPWPEKPGIFSLLLSFPEKIVKYFNFF